MTGIFKILFNLKLKNSNQPLEDYLTEIFAYCLSEDNDLTNEFLNYFEITKSNHEQITISTQVELKALQNHETDSRPDMAIFSETATFFFENKINAKEGYKQLSRYAEHLDLLSNNEKKIIYITRDFDEKKSNTVFKNCKTLHKNDLIQLRWFDVFSFLKKYNSNLIIFELLNFMKQNKLSMNNQFTPIDILTMSNFSNIRKLMDEVMFGNVSKEFEKVNGSITQPSTCLTQLKSYDRYIYYANHNEKMAVLFGFWMNSMNEKDYPEIGIQIELSPNSKKNIQIRETFRKISDECDGWYTYSISDITKWAALFKKQSLQNILSKKNHIVEIKKYFNSIIQELDDIFNKYSDLPINTKHNKV